jgi:Putative peptidoglycan-binding domain-containing protein
MKSLKRIAVALIVLLLVVTMVPQENVYASEAATNEIKVYNYLVDKMGLNTAAACGLLANAKEESNFNIKETGDGNTSFGLFQWHNGRKANLKKYCAEKKLDYQSVEGQLSFLEYELKKSYKKIYNYLTSVENTAQGAYDAGYYWCYYYEVPSNRASKSVKRGNLSKNTYWKKYKGYKGKVVDLAAEGSSGNQEESAQKVSDQKTNNQKTNNQKTNNQKVNFTRTLKVVKKSMRGNDVLYIQKSLKTLGYSVSADGVYGKKTAAAVKKFQKKNKIKADGKVNKKTWTAIEKAVANKQKKAAK